MSPYLILLVLKQANAVVTVIMLMIRMQKMFVPDVVKNLNVKVFNLMSGTNETRQIKWHETCNGKCRLDQLQVFVIINNVGVMINVDANVKN